MSFIKKRLRCERRFFLLKEQQVSDKRKKHRQHLCNTIPVYHDKIAMSLPSDYQTGDSIAFSQEHGSLSVFFAFAWVM